MATSEMENTEGNASSREDSSQKDNKVTYWQVGKTVTDCLYSLYERGLWTDVRIRCKDQQLDDPDDILCAHKVILAARSPVFSAMFYGSFGEDRSDIELLEYSNKSVDAFLRYLYHDQTPLNAGITHEVLKLAHFYQVTGLVEQCAHNLAGDLTAENACAVLKTALLYDLPSLKRSAVDFIDMNAEAVLESDGFLEISRDTLEYLIKGDTLFAEEILIVTQVYRWAVTKLSSLDKTVTRKDLRELLGQAYSYLRFTDLTTEQFLDFEQKRGIHTRQECLDIACSLKDVNKCTSDHRASKSRVSLTSKYHFKQPENTFGFMNQCRWAMNPNSLISIKTKTTIALSGLVLYFRSYGIHYFNKRITDYAAFDGELSVEIELICSQIRQNKTALVQNGQEISVTLDPPIVLQGSETGTYELNVTARFSMIPKLCFQITNLGTEIIPSEREQHLTINQYSNSFVKCLVLSHLSGRSMKD